MFRRFEYVSPLNLQEAIQTLTKHEQAVVFAGGTDLLPGLRLKSGSKKLLVDIKRCPELKGVKEEQDHLSIGALTTIREIQQNQLIKEKYRALWDAANVFGCLEIRNRATVGGNIVHASPGAESGTPLFAFEAEVEITGLQERRVVPIREFWLDAGKVDLGSGEIVSRILLPKHEREVDSRYARVSRVKGMDLAALGITVVVIDPGSPDTREIRVALSAVERTPYRNSEAEAILSHRELDDSIIAFAKERLIESIHPRETSLRAGPEYKRAMVGNLLERLLKEMGVYR